MPELGLFPLPVVLVPTERVPLHIFESRYKELIRECLDTDGELGLVLATGDGAVHEIGTRAHVVEVLDELGDGSMNVIVEGSERFRLLELTSGRSFTTGIVEDVVDDPEPFEAVEAARARDLFMTLAGMTGSDIDPPAAEATQLDFEMAAHVDFGADAKQELLSMSSPRARMARLAELLAQAIEAVRLEQMLHERAGGNGKVAPLDPDAPDGPGGS